MGRASLVTRRRSILRSAALSAAAAFAVGACGTVTSTPVAAIAATDLTGREVRLAEPARRVVAIPMPAASMLVAVNGGPEVLAGMNPSAKKAIEQGYLGQIFPELLDVASDVSTQDFVPIMENLLRVDPDLVIQWGDRGAGLADPLLNAGFTVAQLEYGTQQYLEEAILLYGQLLDRQDRAQQLVSRMRTHLGDLERRAETATEHPVTLHLSGFENGLKVETSASYSNFVIELVGGRNPAAGLVGNNAAVGFEQILAWNPEIILLGNFDPVVPADLYSDPKWRSIAAVQAKRVYKIPLGGYRWEPPNQESPLFWEWASGVIRDDAVPGGLFETIRQDYDFLYGHRPTDDQLRQILQVPANANSRAYSTQPGSK